MWDEMEWWGTGLEALGVLVALIQGLLYGLPGTPSPEGDRPGDRLQAWLQGAPNRIKLGPAVRRRLLLTSVAVTTFIGVAAIGESWKLWHLPTSIWWWSVLVMAMGYGLAGVHLAPRGIEAMGKHLRAILAAAGAVFALGVVLQFAAITVDPH